MKNTTIIIMAIMFFLFGGMVGNLVQTLIGIKKLEQKDNFYQTQIAQKDNTIQTLEKTQDTTASLLQTLMDANKKLEQKEEIYKIQIAQLQKALNEVPASKSPLTKEPIPDIKEVHIPDISQETLDNILSGNEPREKVEASIQTVIAALPPVYVKDLIKKYTDIPIEDMPADDKLGEYTQNLFKIFKGQSPGNAADNGENILFTTSVNADNSPISPTISFRVGDRQIYACFANQGTLSGLSKLVHRWTNKSTGEIIKLETRVINPDALFNYIWVRKTDGWQVGEYEVVLFKTQTLEMIAEGKFTIVAEENKEEDVRDKSDKSKEPEKPAEEKKILSVYEVYDLIQKGRNLTDEKVGNLENILQENPDDLTIRTELLGYYFLKAHESNSARKLRQKHILWIIQNRPDSMIAGLPETYLDPSLDKEEYFEAKKLWLTIVGIYKNNVSVIGNAAHFLLLYDRDIAENLIQKAKTLEPDNPEWSKRLAQLYRLDRNNLKSNQEKKESAKKELKLLEAVLEKQGDKDTYYLLADLAETSFAAGEMEKAKRYATELLDKSLKYKSDWNYGNAIHHGNLLLGRLALKLNNIKEAKSFLLKAGATPGSPQLDSFGPNMSLAKELLEAKEKETVIQYLELCKKFWKEDRLNNWIQIIKSGGMPDFEANLDY